MFQRFAYFGFQTLLFLYLKHELKFSLRDSIALYHAFLALGFIAPIIFSMIADKCLSKYCTIMIAALIALLGDVLVTLAASSAGPQGIKSISSHIVLISMIGLTVRSIGVGGMREVVRSFGGDQFCLPQEEYYLRSYYQAFYYFMAFGTVAGIVTVPLLRMHVECFGQLYCFPLAFGVATAAMFLAVTSLLCGCTAMTQVEPSGSVVMETCICIGVAVNNRAKQCGPTWLDNASVIFTDSFICDVRATLRVLLLYIPLPFFWALYELQGSLWVYQATRMIFTLSYRNEWYIEPDHMQATTHIVVFIVLPLLESYMYSLCRRIYCCRTALRRIMIGGLLAVLAFVAAAVVELKVERTYAKLPKSGEAHVVLFDGCTLCPIHTRIDYINSTYYREAMIWNVDHVFVDSLPVTDVQPYQITVALDDEEYPEECGKAANPRFTQMLLVERKVMFIYITYITDMEKEWISYPPADDLPFSLEQCDLQLPLTHLLYSSRLHLGVDVPYDTVKFKNLYTEKDLSVFIDNNHHGTFPFHMHPSKYGLYGLTEGWGNAFDFNVHRGGVYTAFFIEKGLVILRNVTTLTEPNSVHMSWQFAQYTLMALAYFLLPVTLLQFSYQQVPVRMKPALLSSWYLSIALGNLLAVALAYTAVRLLWFYVTYAALMGAAMLLMMVIFCNYRHVWPDEDCQPDCVYVCWSQSEWK